MWHVRHRRDGHVTFWPVTRCGEKCGFTLSVLYHIFYYTKSEHSILTTSVDGKSGKWPPNKRTSNFTLLVVVGVTVLSTIAMVTYPFLLQMMDVGALPAGTHGIQFLPIFTHGWWLPPPLFATFTASTASKVRHALMLRAPLRGAEILLIRLNLGENISARVSTSRVAMN